MVGLRLNQPRDQDDYSLIAGEIATMSKEKNITKIVQREERKIEENMRIKEN